MRRVLVGFVFFVVATTVYAASCPETPQFHVYVRNDTHASVKVDTERVGVRWTLGRASAGMTTAMRANCFEFMNRRTDFILRGLAERDEYRLEGVYLFSCADSLTVWIPSTGVNYANVAVW